MPKITDALDILAPRRDDAALARVALMADCSARDAREWAARHTDDHAADGYRQRADIAAHTARRAAESAPLDSPTMDALYRLANAHAAAVALADATAADRDSRHLADAARAAGLAAESAADDVRAILYIDAADILTGGGDAPAQALADTFADAAWRLATAPFVRERVRAAIVARLTAPR